MKPLPGLFAACALLMLLGGCATHTVISSGSTYPPDSPAYQAADFFVAVDAHGAAGKAYTDHTPKTLWIYLSRGGKRKNLKRVKLTAAALSWEVAWLAAGEPVIRFYEMPEGLTKYDARYKAKRRLVLTKHYRYDAAADRFAELDTIPNA